MLNPNFLSVTASMIAEVQRRGHTPLCFAMNRETRANVAREFMEFRKQKMSALSRAWHWMRNRNAVPILQVLHGLPVMDNPALQTGAVFLQSASGMGPAPGMEQAAQNAAQENQQRGSEFWRKEPVAPPAEDAAPTLNDLASGNGERPSASDVLMKAIEQADQLRGVVVVRVFRNGSIDLCLNVDQFAAQGVLQKAQVYLMHGGM